MSLNDTIGGYRYMKKPLSDAGTGELLYVCRVCGHYAAGMRGRAVVAGG